MCTYLDQHQAYQTLDTYERDKELVNVKIFVIVIANFLYIVTFKVIGSISINFKSF